MNSKTSTRYPRVTLTAALVGSLALLGVFGARADDLVPKAKISFSDLDLSTPSGARAMYDRIVKASYDICRAYDRDSHYNADPLAAQACRRQVVADTVSRLRQSALYAVYNARNATPLPAPIVTAGRSK